MLEEDDEDTEENSCIPRGTPPDLCSLDLSTPVGKGIRERIPQKLKSNLLPHYIVSKKTPKK